MARRPEDEAFRRYQATGDPSAVAEVFDALAPRLLLLAVHLSGRRGGAEDLLQSTFLAALEHPERWDGARPVAGWLVGIMRHHAIDLARKGGGVRMEAIGEELPFRSSDTGTAEHDEFFAALELSLIHI